MLIFLSVQEILSVDLKQHHPVLVTWDYTTDKGLIRLFVGQRDAQHEAARAETSPDRINV